MEEYKKVVLTAIENRSMDDDFGFDCIDESLYGDKDVMMATAKAKMSGVLFYATEDLRDDEELVFEAVQILDEGSELAFANDRFKNNDRMVNEAAKYVTFTSSFFNIVNERFSQNRDFVLEVVTKGGWNIASAPEQYKDDEEVVLAAIVNTSMEILDAKGCVSERLRTDSEFREKAKRMYEEKWNHHKVEEVLEVLSDRRKEEYENTEGVMIASQTEKKVTKEL